MTRVLATAGGYSNIEIGGVGGDNKESHVAKFRFVGLGLWCVGAIFPPSSVWVIVFT